MRCLVPAVVLLTACPYKPERIERVAECSASTPELGSAGAYTVQTLDLPVELVPILGRTTGPQAFRIPEDVVSVAITWQVADSVDTRISYVELDGEVLLEGQDAWEDGPNGWETPPLFHVPESGGTVILPLSPDVQLQPGACLLVEGSARRSDADNGVMTVQTRRDVHEAPTVDLNIYRVGNTRLAPDDLTAALDHARQLWSAADAVRIGEVREYTIEWDSIPDETDAEMLYPLLTEGPARALNILVVQDLLNNDGTLGFAGGIPGAIGLQGAANGAVLVSVDTHLFADGTMDSQYLGETIAHEAGHQLGLAHTTEAAGAVFELLTDTPECPLSQDTDGDETLTAEECVNFDGDNFMFWAGASFLQDAVSSQQAAIVRDSVIVRDGAL